jgi:hypothetical protein
VSTNLFYGLEGWENLESSVEDAVEQIIDLSDSIEWPLEIIEFKHKDKPKPEHFLERILEWLDEEYADPEGNPTEGTPEMIAATKVILDKYIVWLCEETGNKITVTEEEAVEMHGGAK